MAGFHRAGVHKQRQVGITRFCWGLLGTSRDYQVLLSTTSLKHAVAACTVAASMTRLCVRSRRRSQAHRARVHGVIQVFEVLAKNLMMKTMERKLDRLVLEQAVAMFP